MLSVSLSEKTVLTPQDMVNSELRTQNLIWQHYGHIDGDADSEMHHDFQMDKIETKHVNIP